MALYLITHRHDPCLCRVAFAAWHGVQSPLRRHHTLSSCVAGGHSIWWRVEADDEVGARALLPEWIAERSEVAAVSEVEIP